MPTDNCRLPHAHPNTVPRTRTDGGHTLAALGTGGHRPPLVGSEPPAAAETADCLSSNPLTDHHTKNAHSPPAAQWFLSRRALSEGDLPWRQPRERSDHNAGGTRGAAHPIADAGRGVGGPWPCRQGHVVGAAHHPPWWAWLECRRDQCLAVTAPSTWHQGCLDRSWRRLSSSSCSAARSVTDYPFC